VRPRAFPPSLPSPFHAGSNGIRLFTFVTDATAKKLKHLSLTLFYISLLFAFKARSHPSGALYVDPIGRTHKYYTSPSKHGRDKHSSFLQKLEVVSDEVKS